MGLTNVWKVAAKELAAADNIIVVGYSLPETDSYFKYLFALGSDSDARLRNFIVVNNSEDASLKQRYRSLVGKGIEDRVKFWPAMFSEVIENIKDVLYR